MFKRHPRFAAFCQFVGFCVIATVVIGLVAVPVLGHFLPGAMESFADAINGVVSGTTK